MDIVFLKTQDLERAARFTYDNMLSYYKTYGVDWDILKIIELTKALDNYDLIYAGEIVGVMRLEFDQGCCTLRDLQVADNFQGKGIGTNCLLKAKRMAQKVELDTLKLRVFKNSPAVKLYKVNGFVVESEDDRFLNMKSKL